MEKDKIFFPISIQSRAGQLICCSNKKVDLTMLLNHYLANQNAGKTVRISCHKIMCWYELTVQFYGSSTCMVDGPVVGALRSVLPGSNPTIGKTKALKSFRLGRPALSLKQGDGANELKMMSLLYGWVVLL